MNQLAAFFAQMTSPTAAGMGGRAQAGAGQGDAFANILAQFQAAFLNEASAAGTTAQPTTAVDPLLQAAANANLSTEDLVAKLKALAGGDGSKIDALLAALAPQQTTQDQPKTEAQTADATLAHLLASLQVQIQSPAGQQQPSGGEVAAPTTAATPATDGAASADLALRGSFAVDAAAQAQDAAHHLQPTDTKTTPDAKAAAHVVENAAIALAPAVAAQTKQKSEQATTPVASAADKPAAKPQPNGTQTQPAEQAATGAKPKHATELDVREAPAKPKAGAGAPTSKPSDSTAQAQTPTAAAAPAPVTANLVNIQQVTTAVAAAPQAGIPLDALAVHIARKFEAGSSQFEISLHPADLGRLDISLNVADDGHVQAVLRAERPETLDLLQRDARSLEQQLRQAGLDVGQGALSFSLSSGNGQRQAPFAGWPAFAQAQDDADGVAKQQAASTYIAVRQQGGVDIRV